MVQLITALLIVVALVILVLQNLSPVLGLVVLGRATIELPLAVWLLVAIALGAFLALIIYRLVPKKRAYRPMGERLSDPPPEPSNRFVDSPSDRFSTAAPAAPAAPPAREDSNPYDSDWENFKAPEQWEDWGQQRSADYAARDMPRTGDTVGETVRDIESGWEDDDYDASGRFASRQEAGPDIGWRAESDYREQPPDRPASRTYEEGWLYGNDAAEESSATAEPGEPQPEEPEEDVYDANYRVIIPPYDAKDS